MKIIIIENDTEIFKDLKHFWQLHLSDYELVPAVSGTQCLVDIATKAIDPCLIILCIKPSDRNNNLYLIEQIRDYSDIPIVVLSYDTSINTLVSCFDAGVNDFITCPYNERTLAASLNAVIRRSNWDSQIKKNNQVICTFTTG